GAARTMCRKTSCTRSSAVEARCVARRMYCRMEGPWRSTRAAARSGPAVDAIPTYNAGDGKESQTGTCARRLDAPKCGGGMVWHGDGLQAAMEGGDRGEGAR